MKRSRTARLMLMSLVPLALTACEEKVQEAQVYSSVDECVSVGMMDRATCQSAYADAQAAAVDNSPRYANRADCVADFGEQQCSTRPHAHGYFFPLMTGFLLANSLNNRGALAPQPLYRPRTGNWTTAGGYNVGRSTGLVRVDPAAAQPQRAVTQSRAGFGSTAAARSGAGS